MSDAVIIAAIAAIPPTLMAFLSYKQSQRNGAGIAAVHETTNGMNAALVSAARKEGHRDGVQQEQDKAATKLPNV